MHFCLQQGFAVPTKCLWTIKVRVHLKDIDHKL